jgi:hypothetical protein
MVYKSINAQVPAVGSQKTIMDRAIYNRTGNLSKNWDSSIAIVQVAIIVTVLAAAIGAIFLFTRVSG